MTIEIIRSLITSKQDEDKITQQIIKLLKDDPSLASSKDLFGRTIFHLLLVQGKYKVFEALLETKLWRDAALLSDHREYTILHYVVEKESENASDLINIVLEHLPSLVNKVNKAGNTALHEAIIAEKLWAAKCLITCRHIDRTIKNKDKKTVVDLAEGKRGFKQALLRLNLSSLDLRSRIPQPGSEDDLRVALPTLSSPDTLSSSSPKTSEPLHSPQKLAESDSSESEDLEDYQRENTLDLQEDKANLRLHVLLKKLASELKQNKESELCRELQALFVSECHRVFLSEHDLEITPEIAEAIATWTFGKRA